MSNFTNEDIDKLIDEKICGDKQLQKVKKKKKERITIDAIYKPLTHI